MRTYAQAPKTVWDIDYATAAAASLPAASSVHSGSFASIGYSRLTGVVYCVVSECGNPQPLPPIGITSPTLRYQRVAVLHSA